MRDRLAKPDYQISAHHGLAFSLGCNILLMLAVASGVLFFMALTRSFDAKQITPALKAGLGFFAAVTLACSYAYYRLITRTGNVEDLRIGDRLVKSRWHREQWVFSARQCLYFADVRDTADYRKALIGLAVGTHIFYLDDGAYFTAEGVRATVGRRDLRSAVVFMRAFQEYVVRRSADVDESED